jgi:hypothetical protein
VREGLDHGGTQEPHEASEADNADIPPPQLVDKRPIIRITRRPASRRHTQRLYACASRAAEAFGSFAAGDHDGDRGVETAVRDGVDERLKVAAAARNENSETPGAGIGGYVRHLVLFTDR